MRLLLLLSLGAAAAAQDRQTVPVHLKKERSAARTPRVLFPQTRFLLTARHPAGLKGVPELSKRARYAVFTLGARRLVVAFDAPEATPALGIFYGSNGASTVGRARPLGKEGFSVDFKDAVCAGLVCNVRLVYKQRRATGGIIELAHHRRGRAFLGGAVREVLLIDTDADGAFNGTGDRWIALRADKAAQIKTLSRPAALLLKEPQIPFEKDGRALTVERVARDGSQLLLVLDKPRMKMRAVLRRRYREVRADHFAEFEREMVAFIEEQKLDVTREAVLKPARWRLMPLSSAKELAKKEGKPLLVSFFTESNPWCYRYEYYTFHDAEADRLLRRFVRVRIDAEKDPEKSYQKNSARGLPTLMPFTASGKRVMFKLRSREKDLAKEEGMITGWQRPQELVVNLKRILKACSER